jgi:hypothetical protein
MKALLTIVESILRTVSALLGILPRFEASIRQRNQE